MNLGFLACVPGFDLDLLVGGWGAVFQLVLFFTLKWAQIKLEFHDGL